MTDPAPIEAAIEALLILASEPLAEERLAQTLATPTVVVREALDNLRRFYDETGRGFELRQVGDGWRYYVRPEQAGTVIDSIAASQPTRLSQAGLETLAVIAYLQPISRSRIAAVRGVNVDGVVRTLIGRHLVAEVAHDQASGAGLLGTTTHFLERMGLTTLDQLPALAPHLPDASSLDEELKRLTQGADLGDSADEETSDAQH